ncbi:ABC transporter ATP-binding protein, partial [bacterium]|nr:ABC transporter ATP-binding protein [bacterium]
DEPAAGLDPRARIELMEILRELRRMGKTVFISSHILAELATLCDSVTIIDRGRTKFCGPMEELLSRRQGDTVTYLLRLAADHAPLADVLGAIEGVLSVDPRDDEPAYRVTFHQDELDNNTLLAAVLATGAQVVEFLPDTRQLDEAFLDLTEPGVPT